ncbi:MAG: hypothetical protein JXA64_00525 [Candidatus Fermentibacteraceae bacterium]|nr:hypothetical protein [Candidatus Fermentibacteraceae bacterium]MBN2607570.1 hypothetical protein [Candidatus Fermentibacteraceae bacterium]
METRFAPAPRVTENQLSIEVRWVSGSPVVTGLLKTVSGLLAILDEHRQIVALNESFMKMLDLDSPAEALGLRPGDILRCIHSGGEPAGCGTTEFCGSCGAAVAIVASLGEDRPVERLCALQAKMNGEDVDLVLMVRSQPIRVQGMRFLLLFLKDITQQYRYAALERTFFHDVSNMVGILLGSSELLAKEDTCRSAAAVLHASRRIADEVAIQRVLSSSRTGSYQPLWRRYTAGEILDELRAFFAGPPVEEGKRIVYPGEIPDAVVTTDSSLLMRVLSNMVINALEATEPGGEIRISIDPEGERMVFSVWNEAVIPATARKRIFQRNFSTKDQPGRGIGTYSMKLLGEELLGGSVSFASSEDQGTVFRFSIPVHHGST